MIYNMPGGSKHILSSGHVLTVPVLKPSTRGIQMMDTWLLTTMLEEAARRGDAWTPTLFSHERPGRFPPATRDSLNDYIFMGSQRMGG